MASIQRSGSALQSAGPPLAAIECAGPPLAALQSSGPLLAALQSSGPLLAALQSSGPPLAALQGAGSLLAEALDSLSAVNECRTIHWRYSASILEFVTTTTPPLSTLRCLVILLIAYIYRDAF